MDIMSHPYLKISRPLKGLVIGTGLMVGYAIAGSIDYNFPFLGYLYLFIGAFLITSHSMVQNDIIDLEIDKINEPQRMLPSGLMNIREASILSWVLAVVGVFFFAMVDVSGFTTLRLNWLWGVVHLLLGDLYNFRLKGTGFIGNLLVAYMSFALFLYPDLFLNGTFTTLPLIFGIISLLMSLTREILKGIIDMKGDRKFGIKTVAVQVGPSFARNVAIFLTLLNIGLGIYIFEETHLLGKIGFVGLLLFFLYILSFIWRSVDPEFARKSKNLIALGPLLIAPFLILDQIYVIS